MNIRCLLAITGIAALGGSLNAQNLQRRAAITGGGNNSSGSCTAEVVVDGAAEVDIHGDQATLRDISGNRPQWQNFECTSAMPSNPGDLHFEAIDGRGRQQMISNPGNGTAVVRIQDSQGGASAYRFRIDWGGNGYSARTDQGRYEPQRQDDRYRNNNDDRYRNNNNDRSRNDEDRFYQDRDRWSREGDWHARFFDRVSQDLEHAQSMTFPIGQDNYRLDNTKRELNQLQEQTSSGRYDRRELDDVIRSLRRVVRDNRLSDRNRQMLNDDLRRMEEMRDQH